MEPKFLIDLNTAQKEAATTTEGPVLILAGAGSGKTKTLAARLAFLVAVKKVSPFHVFAVTFTNKAAEEMGQRVDKLLRQHQNKPVKLPWLGTFHRLCAKILRFELDKSELPFNGSFVIYDSQDQLTLIKQISKELQLDPKQYPPRLLRAYIDSAKGDLLNAAQYATQVQGKKSEVAASVFQHYEQRLVKANALDFNDLINKVLELWRTHPQVLAKYQQWWRYLLVDEYQDTNKAQYELLRLLAAKHQNIFVVGDDWQAIYGFRGADFKNILNFSRDYPEAKVIKLEENYRSTQNILDAAHAVMAPASKRSDKQLFTRNKTNLPVVIVECEDDYSEGDFVLQEIKELAKEDKLGLDNFVVLYRTNAQSRLLEELMLQEGLPYRLVGALRFYERKEIKDILAYLRLVANPQDSISLARASSAPSRGVGPKTIANYLADSNKVAPKLAQFLEQVAGWRKNKELTPKQLMEQIIKDVKLEPYYNDGSTEGESRWENILELLNAASEFDDLADFLERVSLVQENETTKESDHGQNQALTLMTLHAAKGLEFDTVFVVGLEENLLPHANSLFEQAKLEEERRLCYVGMTRAKRRLYLLYALRRSLFGNVMANAPSRFLAELPMDLLELRQWERGW